MIGDVFSEEVDRWVVPDDRQLALRGRLGTGWSTICINSDKQEISEVERDYVITVLRRNEYFQIQEQYRIGRMVTKLNHMKKHIYGDGVANCLICGSTPGLFRDAMHFCRSCGMLACSKCSIELRPPYDGYGKYHVCVLCNEDRMVWKRSGAWFYRAIPTHIITDDDNGGGNITVPENWVISHPIGVNSHLRKSQDSIVGGSDESDVTEHTSTFEVTEEKIALEHCDVIINEDSRSLNSFSASFKKQSSIKETILQDESKSNSHNDLHSSLSSTSSNSSSKMNEDILETVSQTSHGSLRSLPSSTDSIDETKVSVLRKISKHLPIVAVNSSNSLKQQDRPEVGLERSQSSNSINSEQDVDALFTSYEEKKSKETEYTGPRGMIQFTLQYDPNNQDLLIIIDSCNGLKIGESEMIPSAYVKSIILPVSPDSAKASKKRTPTIRKTADPVYNFCFNYPGVSSDDIARKGVQLSVIDETNSSSKNTIGETCVPLKGLVSHPIQQFRRILDSRAQTDSLFLDFKKVEVNAGRIELALHYLSKQEKLIVGIIRCVGLKALDPNGYSDPYVKCYLLPDPEKRSKQKTNVKKKTLNPEFNEELQFEISHSDLAQKTLYLAVWDHDLGRKNDFIGGLSLGIESTGDVLKHWFETLQTADKRFIRWHDLDDNCLFFNE